MEKENIKDIAEGPHEEFYLPAGLFFILFLGFFGGSKGFQFDFNIGLTLRVILCALTGGFLIAYRKVPSPAISSITWFLFFWASLCLVQSSHLFYGLYWLFWAFFLLGLSKLSSQCALVSPEFLEKLMLPAIFWSGLLAAILGLFQWVMGSTRPQAFFVNPNHFSCALIFSILSVFTMNKNKKIYLFLLPFLLFILLILLLTSSRAGILCLILLPFVYFVFLTNFTFRKFFISFLCAFLALGFLWQFFLSPRIKKDPYSLHRIVLWKANMNLIRERILTGWGPGSFSSEIPKMQYLGSAADLMGTEFGLSSIGNIPWNGKRAMIAHGLWFELAIAGGLILLTLFLSFLIQFSFRLWKIKNKIYFLYLITFLFFCSVGAIAQTIFFPAFLVVLFSFVLNVPSEEGGFDFHYKSGKVGTQLILGIFLLMCGAWSFSILKAQEFSMTDDTGIWNQIHLRFFPFSSYGWMKRAALELKKGNQGREEAALKRSASFYPGNRNLWFNLAGFYLRSNQKEKAVIPLQHYVALDPYDPDALLARYYLKNLMGDSRAASEEIRYACFIEPSFRKAWRIRREVGIHPEPLSQKELSFRMELSEAAIQRYLSDRDYWPYLSKISKVQFENSQ